MSGVVRAEEFARVPRGAVRLNLSDFEQMGAQIISRARAEATELLSAAQAEAAALRAQESQRGREEGYRAGHAEGLDAGAAEGLKQAQERFAEEQAALVQTLQQALGEFDRQRHVLLARAEHDLVGLALAIARRIVKRIAAGDPEVAVENLREVLERIGRRHVLRIGVHPQDAEALRRFVEALAAEFEAWRHVTLEESTSVGPGGVVVEVANGQVDARIDTQLDRIAELLTAPTPER